MALSYSPDITSEITADDADRDDYRRCARRLRAIHADKPERLQPALLQLAQAMDVKQRTTSASLARLDSPAAMFAESVTSRLTEGLLRYSERLALFEESDRLGIGRFEANLIIAMVQHRSGIEESNASDAFEVPDARTRHTRMALTFLAVVLAQSAIFLGFWWIAR